jgi:hypothetical protein
MNTRKPQLLAGIVAIVATAALYLLLGRGAERDSTRDLTATTGSALWESYSNADGASPATGIDTSEYTDAPAGASATANLETYTDPQYGFSFKHPADYTVSAFDDSGGTMTLVTGSGADQTFQIFIQPVGAIDALDPSKIRRELPDKVIDEPHSIVFSDNYPALIFLSRESGKQVRELWFVYDGQLFQVRSPLSFDANLARIMVSWQFE